MRTEEEIREKLKLLKNKNLKKHNIFTRFFLEIGRKMSIATLKWVLNENQEEQ